MTLRLLPAIAVLLAAGCGDDGGPGTDAALPDTGGPEDAGFDAGLPEPSYLFGPCTTDEQCPGPDAFCRTASEDGLPGGHCTRNCIMGDRELCDDGVQFHECLDHEEGGYYCEQRCLNGVDCGREAYSCLYTSATDGICIGICSSDEHCGPGAECDVWNGRCYAAGEVPTVGSEHGGTCAVDDDCLGGNCIEANSGGYPTGWNGGYCYGPCILPLGYNSSSFFAGAELPQGTCPGGYVCFPNGSLTEGDIGICLSACTSSADCRTDDGHECVRSFGTASGTTMNYPNGICRNITPDSCAGEGCPAGFRCTMVPGRTGSFAVCERM